MSVLVVGAAMCVTVCLRACVHACYVLTNQSGHRILILGGGGDGGPLRFANCILGRRAVAMGGLSCGC